MTGSYTETQVRLYRDTLSTPWGFRLQGGADFKAPLTVQRVFVGSPADGTLSRGDVITSVENYDASRMIHKQAMDIIKQAGGNLALAIRRSASARRPTSSTAVTPQNGMLSRVSHSLADARVAQASQPHRKPVSVGPGPVWTKPHPSTMMSQPPSGLVEPGWTPRGGQGQPGWKPVSGPGAHPAPPMAQHVHHVPAPQQYTPAAPPPQPVHHRPAPQPVNRPAPQPVNRTRPAHTRPTHVPHVAPESPAWAGSLKSSGGPKPWEMREAAIVAGGGMAGIPPAPQAPVNVHQPRVQTVNYGPGSTVPTYGQANPSSHGPSDTAQVKHLQYNTPIGLYSRDNVQEVLSGQTSGKPGEGTLQVSGGGPGRSFDPDRSDVLRLLQEEETIKQRGYGLRPSGAPTGQSARYVDQEGPEMNYQGFMDHSKKSPAMARLEYNLESGVVGADSGQAEGTSDF